MDDIAGLARYNAPPEAVRTLTLSNTNGCPRREKTPWFKDLSRSPKSSYELRSTALDADQPAFATLNDMQMAQTVAEAAVQALPGSHLWAVMIPPGQGVVQAKLGACWRLGIQHPDEPVCHGLRAGKDRHAPWWRAAAGAIQGRPRSPDAGDVGSVADEFRRPSHHSTLREAWTQIKRPELARDAFDASSS